MRESGDDPQCLIRYLGELDQNANSLFGNRAHGIRQAGSTLPRLKLKKRVAHLGDAPDSCPNMEVLPTPGA
jgi:hypothetical protein